MAAALSAFDILVFPSLWEGTPLTVFEALAMGKPIVATDADGLVDVLTDRKDALIVPKGDAAALPRPCPCSSNQLAAGLMAEARWTGQRATSPPSFERWSSSTSSLTRRRARPAGRYPEGRPEFLTTER